MTERLSRKLPTLKEAGVDSENIELYLGLSTLVTAQRIVQQQPEISTVHFQAYHYVPNAPSNPDENIFPVDRNVFLGSSIVAEIIETFDNEYNLALNSNVTLKDGSTNHFQMMDLAPRKSKESLKNISKQFNRIITPRFGGGLLLETNKSYHYLGLNMVNQEEWWDFLGLNLTTSIVTQVDENLPRVHEIISDYRYIGWSMLRRFTGLRVTTRGTKEFDPQVVAAIS